MAGAKLELTLGTVPTTPGTGVIGLFGQSTQRIPMLVDESGNQSVVDSEYLEVLNANYTLANNTSAQPLFNGTANGAVTLLASTTYEFEIMAAISGLSSSAHTINMLFGGTATFSSIGYFYDAQTGTTLAGPTAALSGFIAVATATAVVASGTTTGLVYRARGIMRVNAGGTVIPQITQVTASAAAVVQANSYFKLVPVGSNAVVSVGPWS